MSSSRAKGLKNVVQLEHENVPRKGQTDPDNQRPDKWSSTVFTSDLKRVCNPEEFTSPISRSSPRFQTSVYETPNLRHTYGHRYLPPAFPSHRKQFNVIHPQ